LIRDLEIFNSTAGGILVNEAQPPARSPVRTQKTVVLILVVAAIWGFLGYVLYFNFVRTSDPLTYDEIGQCLDAKPKTVGELINCLKQRCNTKTPDQLEASSMKQRDGAQGVQRLLATLKQREERIGKLYDIHHGPMLATIVDSEVVDISVIKPEESIGTRGVGLRRHLPRMVCDDW
jgi:hypothetical protein